MFCSIVVCDFLWWWRWSECCICVHFRC